MLKAKRNGIEFVVTNKKNSASYFVVGAHNAYIHKRNGEDVPFDSILGQSILKAVEEAKELERAIAARKAA